MTVQSHKDEKADLNFTNNEKDLQGAGGNEEVLALDGGWGWMVTLGMTVVIVSINVKIN